MLGPLVDSCFCFLSTEHMSREVTQVFEIKKKMREKMKLLKIEFAFQVESKVKSKVKSKKQSKVTVWVGTFKHVKKKQQVSDFLQYLDTRRTKISHYMIQIGFEMLLLSQILLLTLLQLQLQLLLQVSESLCSCCCSSCCSTGSQQFTILKSICVKYVVFLSSLYTNIKKKSCIYYFLASPFKV